MTIKNNSLIKGTYFPPGDKSISHRILILASQTIGKSEISNLLEGEDVLNTLKAMKILGANIYKKNNKYVLTNDNKIKNIAETYNINTSYYRKQILSGDNVELIATVKDFCKSINKKKSYKYIVILQPTSPFRNHMHINEAIKKFLYSKKTTLISVTKTKNFFKTFKINKKNLVTFFKDKNLSSNRQNLSTIYQSNGAIYIFYIKEFLKKKKINYKNFAYYEMNFISSIDIDNKEDYNLAKKLSDDIIYKKEINYSL